MQNVYQIPDIIVIFVKQIKLFLTYKIGQNSKVPEIFWNKDFGHLLKVYCRRNKCKRKEK